MGVFDIIGPVMIGPSSSHTAGAARIGLMARYILKDEPQEAKLTLYGSFAKTYIGHGTDKALIAGLLGYSAEDEVIRDAFTLAKKQHFKVSICPSTETPKHPNMARIFVTGKSGKQVEVLGVSLGGGKIAIREINHCPVDISGMSHTLLTMHEDKPGVVALVSSLLSERKINISSMRVFRKGKHQEAIMMIDTDSPVPEEVVEKIVSLNMINTVQVIKPL